MDVKSELNSKSVASLTLGILSIILPLIGFVPGIAGIIFSRNASKEIDATNENGKGLAAAGLICSIIGIVIQLFGVLGLIAYFSVTTAG